MAYLGPNLGYKQGVQIDAHTSQSHAHNSSLDANWSVLHANSYRSKTITYAHGRKLLELLHSHGDWKFNLTSIGIVCRCGLVGKGSTLHSVVAGSKPGSDNLIFFSLNFPKICRSVPYSCVWGSCGYNIYGLPVSVRACSGPKLLFF